MIVHWRAFHSDRRFLVARQVSNRRLVESRSRVNINSVDNVVRRFGSICAKRVRGLVLTRWREEKAAVRCKCESSKEGGASFIGVNVGVLDSESEPTRHAR